MAAEVGGMPNGTYAPHHAYAGIDQNAYAYSANAAATSQPPAQQAPPASSTPSNAPQAQQPEISKDEVGWYFVEQYYTTLSRSPEKLYLFYNKRSQFVSGTETDKVPVCVGQRAINDRITELSFQDCKVRVTNVDSQASDSNIVIQVIGELSNKGQPHKKFVQTFVLATQTNGYFVLNDVFRYLAEEEEEPEQEAEPAAAPVEDVQQVSGTESGYQEPPPTEVEPKTLSSSTDPAVVERDAEGVDKEIEEKLLKQEQAEEVAAPQVNGEHVEPTEEIEAPAASAEPEAAPAEEEERPVAAEAELQPEKPKDPEPTPIASPPKQAPPQPAPAPKPATPAAPMSWASRAAAANKVATPATPSTASSTSTAPRPTAPAAKTATPPTAPAAASAPAQAAAAPSVPAAEAQQETQPADAQDEWSTVTSSHNRQQSRQTNQPQQAEGAQFRGYIKNVSENVDRNELENKLKSLFGELEYLDIARQKNCAFVDFKTRESHQKAMSTPFKIGSDELIVEERRFRPGSTPYIPRGQYQGGRGGRGGAGGQAQRGQFQGGNRGNAAPGGPRGGRGGNFAGAARGGRGGATQA
ncbi:ntf2 and rrm domain-containing [Lecanosticta acicola]|uniref:Ntf2 and rrm domain-containing n=1 Tax=Lecanosticta acicola TaxID=111012 RepID=A0AAI8YZU9_9PEZI|nr:ntf2 and rrm domain-containing [Lecanosticta acicola]